VVTLAQTLAQFGNLGLRSSNTFFVARDRSLAGAAQQQRRGGVQEGSGRSSRSSR
jgi:hypothetical protein